MKNTPYTVLMSVYIKEKAEYLKLSIQSMLDQTVPPDEFILVKDGPLTTELDAVVDYYNQKYPGLFTIISNETNLGLGPALAKGIVASRNELIARMDSDDVSEKLDVKNNLLPLKRIQS
ncbi:MAG: glycosyltransferase [Coprococcus sp.]